MPKFVCSYAHDVPCYADFVVEAKSEKAALRKIRRALKDGKFQTVETEAYWEDSRNERVFVQGLAEEHSTETTLEQVIGEGHVINGYCSRCGRNVEDGQTHTCNLNQRT